MSSSSVGGSTPKDALEWITAARVEERAGRMAEARDIIKAGCEQYPTNEDVWLESARLHEKDDARVFLGHAVLRLPDSVKLWIATANLETEITAKRQILRSGLEHIPDSIELWLALAGVESPDVAQQVLNKARAAIPTSHEIWIAAARLIEQRRKAEAEGDSENGIPPKSKEELEKELGAVDAIIAKAVEFLKKHSVILTRDQWLAEAGKCEREGSPRTSEAITKMAMDLDVATSVT